MMNEAQLERFVREFHVDPVSGCWMWDGRTSCLGFAMFDLGGGFLSYALEVARAEWGGVPVPPGHMPLDTSWRFCRNRLCVCPDADHNPQAARRAFRRRNRHTRALNLSNRIVVEMLAAQNTAQRKPAIHREGSSALEPGARIVQFRSRLQR
jgi:hypothetical protein